MTIGSFAVVTVIGAPGRRRPFDRRLTAASRAAGRCSPRCSRSSCSPRPGSRSPAGSSPSSACSRPPPTPATTCSVIGVVARSIAAFVYLRVALAVAAPTADGEVRRAASSAGSTSVPGACSPSPPGSTSVLGVVPAVFIDFAKDATASCTASPGGATGQTTSASRRHHGRRKARRRRLRRRPRRGPARPGRARRR